MPADSELVLAAQRGDAASLGLLLERHQPALHASALGILRDDARAQDAVQETFLRVLERLHQLRDPAAVGGWLHAILRNICRMQLRGSGRELPGDDARHNLEARVRTRSLEERIEALAVQDWVWTALAELPEPLRVTAMLRYFGSHAAYVQIAAILGIPVGTVRSRLHQVKVRLADALLRTAELEHDAIRTLVESRARQWSSAWDAFNRGRGYDLLADGFADEPEWIFADGTVVRGRRWFVEEADGDLTTGTRIHLTRLVANRDVLVMESTYENPPDDPLRCPPAVTWVSFYRGDKVQRTHLYFAPRSNAADGDRALDKGEPR
jgi:RNA polymerase sigma-70 factor (ECF subfamily)